MKRTSTRDAIIFSLNSLFDSAELKFADLSGNQFPISIYWSQSNFGKINIPQGLDWAFPSLSHYGSCSAVILAIAVSERRAQDLLVVNTQDSSTGFLFTYHSAIPENFSKTTFSLHLLTLGYHLVSLFLEILRLPKSSGTRRHVKNG